MAEEADENYEIKKTKSEPQKAEAEAEAETEEINETDEFEQSIRLGANDLNQIDEETLRAELKKRNYNPRYIDNLEKRKLILLFQEIRLNSVSRYKKSKYINAGTNIFDSQKGEKKIEETKQVNPSQSDD